MIVGPKVLEKKPESQVQAGSIPSNSVLSLVIAHLPEWRATLKQEGLEHVPSLSPAHTEPVPTHQIEFQIAPNPLPLQVLAVAALGVCLF